MPTVILTTAHCLIDREFLPFNGEVTFDRTNSSTKIRVHKNGLLRAWTVDTIAWSMKNSCDSRLESRAYCLGENSGSNLSGSFHERSTFGRRAHILNGSLTHREMCIDSDSERLHW